jgi:glucosyl-dolichyl phosphate glucuronosyltransferase
MADLLQASIIIPTYKRAAYLSKCLDAVAALEADPATFEIIIVDNNSPDHTHEVCLKFAQAHPELDVRYICEMEQGCSPARNRAVAEARGEILCFLDDDSPPDFDWLGALLEPFRDESVGCTGGPSILDFQGQQVPPWLRGDLQSLLSSYAAPYTVPTPVYAYEELPLSCNMAIKRSVFAEVGLFRTDLGKSGDELMGGGEIELAKKINAAGWKVIYVPQARVNHLVAPQRLDISYIYRRGRGLQESHIRLTSDSNPLKIMRWFVSDLWYATRMFFALVVAFIRRKELWFDDYMRFWMVGLRLPLRARWLVRRILKGAA